jgi:hypothetical protein
VLLPDHEADRIAVAIDTADRDTLARWVRALLDDRRSRSSLLLAQTRRVTYARRRLREAFKYLDGLMGKAEQEARASWPGQLPCPSCGAPLAGVKAEQRAMGHAVVHSHPDGVRCGAEAAGIGKAAKPTHGVG